MSVSADRLAYGTPDGRRLAENLSFEVPAGHLGLVRGPNGCGKSTLLRVLLGLHPIVSGRVSVDGRTAFLPQLENSELHLPFRLGDLASAGALLDPSQLSLGWNTASGGERKRALLTRALAKNPKVLLLDEPMNHLDEKSRIAVLDVLRHTLDAGAAAVMVCHQGLRPEEEKAFRLVRVDFR